MMSSFDMMPIVENVEGEDTIYHVEKECPQKQYCHLQWKNEECETASASAVGAIYGACADMGSSNKTCPNQSE